MSTKKDNIHFNFIRVLILMLLTAAVLTGCKEESPLNILPIEQKKDIPEKNVLNKSDKDIVIAMIPIVFGSLLVL